MAAVPRNAPCPCGSGRKHKLCCGLTRGEERFLAGIAAVPIAFPLLRIEPQLLEDCDPAFTAAVVRAVEALPEREIARLGELARDELGETWSQACADLGEANVLQALLLGAAAAGLRERPLVPAGVDALERLEGRLRDPCDALALVVDPCALWSVREAEDAAAVIDPLDDDPTSIAAATVRRLWTGSHEQRLRYLAGRVREELPLERSPVASAALERACRRFARSRRSRRRLAALLLAAAAHIAGDAGLDLAA